MTSPEPDPQPGTAVVTVDSEVAANLDEQMIVSAVEASERLTVYRAAKAVERTRIIRAASAQIANLQWGTDLDAVTRGAVARWALEAGIDPVRHIDMLGGRIYDNANLYIDACAAHPGFLGDEVVILAPLDRREFDPALLLEDDRDTLLEEQKRLNFERLGLQMHHGVPPEINDHPKQAAAVLVRLFFRDQQPSDGINWAGKYGQKKQDPVGEQHPIKTATTRAYRKAAKKRIPVWFKEGDAGIALEGIEHQIEQDRETVKAQMTGNPKLDGTKRFLSVAGADGLKIADTTGDRIHALKDPYDHRLPEVGTIKGVKETGTPDPYNFDADVTLLCEHCGNWDTVPHDQSTTPICSGGRGQKMRPATDLELNERAEEARIREEDLSL